VLSRFTTRPAIAAATLLLAATLAVSAISAHGSASAGDDGHLPGYPYATLSSVSR
jgi:hypothetical protein